ncbi:MAG TPA: dienelactone hydrolase family protein [Candidatus Limnocylindrales bacterium]|nr:dienelactone hydrolase family protein [Candidatus Limnocylindrales bacterium]
MCFDHDSRPPIPPIAGAAIDSRELTLTADDGNRLTAFEARGPGAGDAAIVILPDVRGLHDYYAELAMRFAEAGVDAVAIDWFGRTAGLGRRREGFDYAPQVQQLTWDGMAADIRAGAAHARTTFGDKRLFTVGFCMGGRAAFLAPTLGLGLTGAIGFYGSPVGAGRGGSPQPVEVADRMEGKILGLFGGTDESIPPAAIDAFDQALTSAGIDHTFKTYAGAPHSFFDRKADEFRDESADAWRRTLDFVAS